CLPRRRQATKEMWGAAGNPSRQGCAHIRRRRSPPPRGPAMQIPRELRASHGLVGPPGSRRCAAPGEVGGKAARLRRLVEETSRNDAPFRVPAGVVVTTAALAQHCARNRIHTDDEPESVAAAIRAGEVAPLLTATLEQAARHLGGGPFAVRSSAVAEDQADASMAGLLEPDLGVTAADLAVRLRDCS